MNIRNLAFNSINTIDCEIEHPSYGWIPFTASPDDPEEHGRIIYQEAIEGKLGEIAPYVEPEITLEDLKASKKDEIVSAYKEEVVQPVVFIDVNWFGGFDSAIKLDAALRLAQTAGLETITFYDIENNGHELDLATAQTVVSTIAAKYQQDIAKKNTLVKAISEATTKEQVNSISW